MRLLLAVSLIALLSSTSFPATASVPQTVAIDGVNDFLPANMVKNDAGDTQALCDAGTTQPLDLGKIYLTNDASYLYFGFEYSRHCFGSINLGMAIDVNTPNGGIADPFGRKIGWSSVPFRPDYVLYDVIPEPANTYNYEVLYHDDGVGGWNMVHDGSDGLGIADADGGTFVEGRILLSDLGVAAGSTIHVEWWVTQEGATKGPLDAAWGDAVQMSRASQTTFDTAAVVQMPGMFQYTVLSAVDNTPPTVSRAVASGFPLLPDRTFIPSTNKIDVTFSEPVDPVTAQTPANYAFSGPLSRSVIGAALDGIQPELVHLTLNGTIGPNAAFYNVTATGVKDLANNTIVSNGTTNVGSFFNQLVNFQGRMQQRLCRGEFAPGDSLAVEGNVAPLTFTLMDNALLYDPNLDSVYTTAVPISMSKDRVTGKAEADLLWKFSHSTGVAAVEPTSDRPSHLSSDNGATVTLVGSWANDPSICLPPSSFTFGQLDFELDSLVASNSQYGECRFQYVAPPERGFLNVVARLPGSGTMGWVVRNAFLPDSALAAPVEDITIRFPLSILGVVDGQFVPALEFDYLLTGAPLATSDSTQWFASVVWNGPTTLLHPLVGTHGHDGMLPLIEPGIATTGWYFPIYAHATTAQVYTWIGCNMPNLDLDDKHHPGDWNGCEPAACANSMKWLDTANVHINIPADLRKTFDQLSDLMYRDTRRQGVNDSVALVAKLDLIEAYGLPIRVNFQSKWFKQPIKSTSGLTSAGCRDTTPGSYPKWGWLAAEAQDSEDVEICGGYYHFNGNEWVRVGGHCIVLTGAGTTGGQPWLYYKHDRDQANQNGTIKDSVATREEHTTPDTTWGYIRVPSLGEPVKSGSTSVPTEFRVDGLLSESYDPSVLPPPDQHTFSAYCQEFRRTLAPHTKLSITWPVGNDRCFNSTISVLDRFPSPPVWSKPIEWNLNSGKTNQYVNNTDHCVTIAVHNDDRDPFSTNYRPFTVTLASSPASAAQRVRPQGEDPALIAETSSPSNPDQYGGFSLGGTTGGPDEFGSPAGPTVSVDGSIGCLLIDVPGRMGAGVQQLTLTHPIPVWNVFWSHLELRLVISTVRSAGDLQISCPSSGYSGTIHVTQPGLYTADLGTVPQTSLFSLTLAAQPGLNFDFDAIGVPSLANMTTSVSSLPLPRIAGLWNLGPTPSTGSISLRFDLPQRGRVDLGVYDVAGRRVSTLVSDVVAPGTYRHNWNGRDTSGHLLASGVYFCRMTVDGSAYTTRLVIAH